jgi:hypothetical protein
VPERALAASTQHALSEPTIGDGFEPTERTGSPLYEVLAMDGAGSALTPTRARLDWYSRHVSQTTKLSKIVRRTKPTERWE